MEYWWWLQGRRFHLWQCVRDQIEKIAPYTFFYFCFWFLIFPYSFFYFLDFLPCFMLTGHFFISFFVFFMFTIFGIPDIERRKRGVFSYACHKDLCPKVVALLCLICFHLKFTFSCGLPTWKLIPYQFKWCSAGAANVAFVVSVIVDVVLCPAVVLHRVPVPAFGQVHVSVMVLNGWKVSVLPFSVIVCRESLRM